MQSRTVAHGYRLLSARNGFFYRRFASSHNGKKLYVELTPELSPRAKIVIPVSMARYDRNKPEFDAELSALFHYTAAQLEEKEIDSVDVIATTALHEDWPQSKINEIDEHFLKTHREILAKQTNCFLWKEWIKKQGKEKHETYYNEILASSAPGSEWYKLMVETHNAATISKDLDISLRYQRQEYAAIRLMDKYNDLIYPGSISPAWGYLYAIYKQEAPRFIKASIKKQQSLVKKHNIDLAVMNAAQQIENIVASHNVSPKDKKELINICINLFHRYGPQTNLLLETKEIEREKHLLPARLK